MLARAASSIAAIGFFADSDSAFPPAALLMPEEAEAEAAALAEAEAEANRTREQARREIESQRDAAQASLMSQVDQLSSQIIQRLMAA